MKKSRLLSFAGAVCAIAVMSVADGTSASAASGIGHIWNNTSATNQCLDVSEAGSDPGIMWYCDTSSAEQWTTGAYTYVGSPAHAEYRIVNGASQCLTGWGKGANVEGESNCDFPTNNMLWTMTYITTEGGYNYYEYKNVATGMCLSVAGGSTANAATPITWTCQGTPDQVWGGPGAQPMG